MDATPASTRQRGLTLLELLVTISIAILLMGWAVPSYQDMRARQEISAETHRLRVALSLARNTAITRRTPVVVCPSPNRQECATGDWSAPLAIMLDDSFEGGFDDNALLQVVEAGRGVSVSYRQDDKWVRYNSLGRPTLHNGTFRICGRHGHGIELIVSNFGRVRTGEMLSC